MAWNSKSSTCLCFLSTLLKGVCHFIQAELVKLGVNYLPVPFKTVEGVLCVRWQRAVHSDKVSILALLSQLLTLYSRQLFSLWTAGYNFGFSLTISL